MSIRNLKEHEIEQVSGGALAVKAVSLKTSFDSLVASAPVSAQVSISELAACCCTCRCCGEHTNLAGLSDLGGVNLGSIKNF